MEKIIFKNSMVDAGPFADWGRSTADNEVISAVPLRNWVIIFTKRNQTQVNDFVKKFQMVARKFGMEISSPRFQLLNGDSTEMYVRCIREQISGEVIFDFVVSLNSKLPHHCFIMCFVFSSDTIVHDCLPYLKRRQVQRC